MEKRSFDPSQLESFASLAASIVMERLQPSSWHETSSWAEDDFLTGLDSADDEYLARRDVQRALAVYFASPRNSYANLNTAIELMRHSETKEVILRLKQQQHICARIELLQTQPLEVRPKLKGTTGKVKGKASS